MAVAGLVLGILSAVGGFIPILNWFAWVFGITGIILSIRGKKQAKAENQPTGTATAGLVLSIIGTVIAFSGFICAVVCVACLGAAGAGLGGLGAW